MSPDAINGCFELAGSILTWRNVAALYKSKGYAGITLPAVFFFTTWGLWNLFYYPSLHQPWSFHGGLSLCAANLVWLGLMLRYGRIK